MADELLAAGERLLGVLGELQKRMERLAVLEGGRQAGSWAGCCRPAQCTHAVSSIQAGQVDAAAQTLLQAWQFTQFWTSALARSLPWNR